MKSILSLLLVITNASTLFAQANKADGDNFVVSVGYLHSFTRVDQSPGNLVGISDYYGKPGLYMGLYYEKIFSQPFVTRSEIIYQSKGVVFDATTNGYSHRRTSNINRGFTFAVHKAHS